VLIFIFIIQLFNYFWLEEIHRKIDRDKLIIKFDSNIFLSQLIVNIQFFLLAFGRWDLGFFYGKFEIWLTKSFNFLPFTFSDFEWPILESDSPSRSGIYLQVMSLKIKFIFVRVINHYSSFDPFRSLRIFYLEI